MHRLEDVNAKSYQSLPCYAAISSLEAIRLFDCQRQASSQASSMVFSACQSTCDCSIHQHNSCYVASAASNYFIGYFLTAGFSNAWIIRTPKCLYRYLDCIWQCFPLSPCVKAATWPWLSQRRVLIAHTGTSGVS